MTPQSLHRQLLSTSSFDVMEMLRQHVPLTVLVDLAFPGDLPHVPAQRLGAEPRA